MENEEIFALVEDGRRLRTVRTRANIVGCCRRLMAKGNIRPTSADIARGAGCSLRSIHEHFPSVTDVYAEAVDDPGTSRAILNHVLGEDWKAGGVAERFVKPIAHAIVAGDTREPRSSPSRRR
jgi:AcrR family transcriptional regulator